MDDRPMCVTYARVRAIETHRMRIDFFSEAKEIRIDDHYEFSLLMV